MRALLLALALTSAGCASLMKPRCHLEPVLMHWSDGTESVWRITVCDARY